MVSVRRALGACLEVIFSPLTLLSTLWLRLVRTRHLSRLPLSRAIFRLVGIFPIRDHFYEPLYRAGQLARPLSSPRPLPGLCWNVEEQLALLRRFHWQQELAAFPRHKQADGQYYYVNGQYGPGGAEFLYSLIRLQKPRRLIEVGSGFSTLMSLAALDDIRAGDPDHRCEITCIDPCPRTNLEQAGVTLLRQRVELADPALFSQLEAGDILFIDSSHVIRPQGDVVRLYLDILPTLQPGVFVHLHDIFTPEDYRADWVLGDGLMWNEQYLLEAFLSCNRDFRIVGALRYLALHHWEALSEVFPVLATARPQHGPSAFWIVRNEQEPGR